MPVLVIYEIESNHAAVKSALFKHGFVNVHPGTTPFGTSTMVHLPPCTVIHTNITKEVAYSRVEAAAKVHDAMLLSIFAIEFENSNAIGWSDL